MHSRDEDGAAPGARPAAAPRPVPHTLLDDLTALATGVLLVALSVEFFTQARLLGGGLAGIAFLLQYLAQVPFGVGYLVLSLPFLWLAVTRMGWGFTLKTLAVLGLVAGLGLVAPRLLQVSTVHPGVAAVVGGTLLGVGFVVLFRHNASLGGIGLLVFHLQEKYGWRAGAVQMGVDVVVLGLSLLVVEPAQTAWSVVATAILNLLLGLNHRPGRYLARAAA